MAKMEGDYECGYRDGGEAHRRSTIESIRRLVDAWHERRLGDIAEMRAPGVAPHDHDRASGKAWARDACIRDLCSLAGIEPPRGTPGPEAQDGSRVDHVDDEGVTRTAHGDRANRVLEMAVAWVSGGRDAETALRNAVCAWWEAELRRLDAAMERERARERAPADTRTPEEREAGVAKMRAWLDNLPPDLAKFYAELRRLDPKGERRPRDPEAIARLSALFAAAPPEWQELFAELDRRDPKMQAPAAQPEERDASRARDRATLERTEVETMRKAKAWTAEPGMRVGYTPALGQVPVVPFKPWRCKCGFEADKPDCHRLMGDPGIAPYCTLPWSRNPDYRGPGPDDSGPAPEKASPVPCAPVLLIEQERARDNGAYCATHNRRIGDGPAECAPPVVEAKGRVDAEPTPPVKGVPPIPPVASTAPRWGWWAMADRRRDLLVEWIERQIGGRPKNERLPLGLAASTLATGAKGWRALPVKNRTAAIAWLAGQRPVVDGEELGGALLESACDWLRGSTPDGDVPPGPGGEPAPHGGGGGQGADVTELEDRVSDLMARENGPAQRFRLVKSQLTAEEARRLEANGWTASVVWVCDDHGEQHERFPDDLALLRSEARPDDGEAPAGEPTGTCSCPACGRGPVRFGGRCDRCGEKLEADVKPPHNAGEGSLCEAARRLAVATGGDPDQAADAAQATRMANLIAEEPARTQLDGPADPAAIDRIRAALATIFPAPAAPARDGEHWTSVKVRPDGQGLRIGLCWTEEEARLERGRAVDFMAERIAGARQGERQSAQAAASELARRWLQARLTVLSNVERRTDRLERNEGIAAAWRVAIEELCSAFGAPEPQPETDIGVRLLGRDEERRRCRHDASYARRKAGQPEAVHAAGPSPLARAVEALRRAVWHRTADRLQRGELTPTQALEKVRGFAADVPPDADDDDEAAIAALEALCAAPPDPAPADAALAVAEQPPSDPLEPYRTKASPEQRAACLHPPDDRQPLSGDGWLCGLCGADCAPPGALAEELTAERLDAVDQLAREPLVRASFAAAPEKILAAAVLALSAEVRRFHGVAKREQHERAKAAEGPLAGERLAVWVCRAGDCDREGASTYRTELQGDGWCENCGRRLHRSGEVAIVPAPPSRELEPGQRWLGAAGARFEIRRGQQAGTLRAVDQDGGAVVFDEPAHAPAHWTRLSPEEPAKPSRVEPGQAWTCVGVGNGGLLLLVASVDGDQIELEGPGGLPMVSASARNMLGLREWSFVRGPVPR